MQAGTRNPLPSGGGGCQVTGWFDVGATKRRHSFNTRGIVYLCEYSFEMIQAAILVHHHAIEVSRHNKQVLNCAQSLKLVWTSGIVKQHVVVAPPDKGLFDSYFADFVADFVNNNVSQTAIVRRCILVGVSRVHGMS